MWNTKFEPGLINFQLSMKPRYNEPLYNEVLELTIFFTPVIVKCWKKKHDIANNFCLSPGPSFFRGSVVSYYPLPSGLSRDNLQQLLVDFVRLLMVQFKIRLSPKVPIRRYRPKTDSASLRAIWAHFKPKHPHHTCKPIPAHAGIHFTPTKLDCTAPFWLTE